MIIIISPSTKQDILQYVSEQLGACCSSTVLEALVVPVLTEEGQRNLRKRVEDTE